VLNIVDVRDVVVPIRSDISNAFIDFSSMTVSVVAVVTDVSLLRSLKCEAHRTADRSPTWDQGLPMGLVSVPRRRRAARYLRIRSAFPGAAGSRWWLDSLPSPRT
jgi:hypothetical protein